MKERIVDFDAWKHESEAASKSGSENEGRKRGYWMVRKTKNAHDSADQEQYRSESRSRRAMEGEWGG